MNQDASKRYFELLKEYVLRPEEKHLLAAADLGRELLMAGTLPEEIGELHEEALTALGRELPGLALCGVTRRISLPLMELLMAYGLFFREQLIASKQAEKKLVQSLQETQSLLEETVNTLAAVTELRDPYTAGHQERTAGLACAIAVEMSLSEEQVKGIHVSALVHDIGKISVPAEILSKPGKLTEIEFTLIKTHVQVGFDTLKTINFPWPVAKIVLGHHEKMNGSGYPQGLSGAEISLEARILAVADVVEAMASHRPYRPAHGIDKALQEVEKNSGVLYDTAVVTACSKLFSEKKFHFK